MKIFYSLFLCLIFVFPSINSWSQKILSSKDQSEIRYLSRKKIETDLVDLLNTLSFADLSEFERKNLIENSYLPNPNQVFFDDAAIVEDDLNGIPKEQTKVADLSIDRYLKNFDLYYKKSDYPSVETGNMLVSELKQAKDHWYVQVFFQITYKSKHSNGSSFLPMWRVAEIRADKSDNQWTTLIKRMGFFDPKASKDKVVNSSTELRNKIVEDSLNAGALKKEYSLRVDELLSLGEQIIKEKNNKNEAVNYYGQAKFLAHYYHLSSRRFEQLYQVYKNKGDIIAEAEIYDKALAWYEVAQALNDSEEIKLKIDTCKKQLKN